MASCSGSGAYPARSGTIDNTFLTDVSVIKKGDSCNTEAWQNRSDRVTHLPRMHGYGDGAWREWTIGAGGRAAPAAALEAGVNLIQRCLFDW
jgi:hypothetical protein